jgi:hypothetical protein
MVNEINRIFLESITGAGLDPSELAQVLHDVERGLRTWVTLQQLEAAHLEIWDPATDRVRMRVDLAIAFHSDPGERYDANIERVRGAVAGVGNLTGCRYRVLVTLAPNAAEVRGWGTTTMRSVDHLQQHQVGDVVNTSRGSVAMSYYW